MSVKQNWTLQKLELLHQQPLFELISQSHHIHCQFHNPGEIQVCTLISVKTGGCLEDCKYCAQSSRYQTPVKAQAMMTHEAVLEQAKEAILKGATRICLGAAWREVREGKAFDEILKMVKAIADLDVEVCCTLGMLKESHAQKLKEAGLYAYNHNLDSSERFYKTIITTRNYQDRLDTLKIIGKQNLSICCGGIIGMGESHIDRLELLLTLSKLPTCPESVPINFLSPVQGTPLEHQTKISIWDMLRMIAITRIVLPKTMIRLSAGRKEFSYEEQTLCFLAGANSIFSGEKLLTVSNTSIDRDENMFELLGLKKRVAFSKHHNTEKKIGF